MKYKLYIVAVLVALLVAIPLTAVLAKRDNLLKIERAEKSQLELKIEKETEQKQQLEQKVQEQEKQKDELQKQNEQLQKDLQAKRERQEQERLAKIAEQKRLEQQRQASSVTRVASSNTGGGCDAYRGLVAQYDWDVNTMMRIMQAESGCNPTNHNWGDNHRTCKGSFGLFQIGCVHGQSVASLENPATNVAVAYNIFKSQGYRAWTTY